MLGMGRIRHLLDGTGAFSWVAIACFALAPLLLLSILLTPHGWQWWLDAHQVSGSEQNGIVSYSYQGQNWTIDDSGSASRTGPRTVYVIAADPSAGALSNTSTVIVDWALVSGPVLIGAGVLALGLRRSGSRRRRSNDQEALGYGQGLPSELVRKITADRHDR